MRAPRCREGSRPQLLRPSRLADPTEAPWLPQSAKLEDAWDRKWRDLFRGDLSRWAVHADHAPRGNQAL